VIEFNRQREKTPGQIVNEFEEMLAIEKARAKERQSEYHGNQHEGTSGNVSNSAGSEEGKTARESAAEKINADVSGRTLEKGKKVKDKATSDDEPETVRETAQEAWEKLESGDETFSTAYDEVKQAEREHEEEQERQQKDEERKERYESADEKAEVHHGDFRDILSNREAESVDHIITDPPYDADAIKLWAALAEHASRVLKPGGFLIAYSGKAHLPRIHDVLSEHLQYHWQGIVTHNGPGAKIFSRKLRTGYKPILIYSNGDANVQEDFVTDVIHGDGREKDKHEWQQAEAEAAELIDRFTAIDDVILDPMCGSGTVGIAARRLSRRCVLIDEDGGAVDTAKERVIQ